MGQFASVMSPGVGQVHAGQRDVGAHRDGDAALPCQGDRTGVHVRDHPQLGHRVVGHATAVGQHVLDDGAGGDQDGPGLPHGVTAFLVEVGAVLDGQHARLQRGHDARLAVAVRGDRPLGQGGDLHDGPQLGRRELLVDGVVQLREHAAGGAHLDQPGPPAELLAHRPLAGGLPVGEAHGAFQPGVVLHPGQGKGVQVPVAAGGGHDRARGVDGRPVQHAFGDGAREVHPEAADLTHGRDPGVERVPQVTGTPRGPERNRLQRQPAEVERARAEEVPVAVPQPGQDGRGPVPPGLRRLRCAPGRPRVADLVPVEHDHTVAHRLPTARNEQVSLDPVHAFLPLRSGTDGGAFDIMGPGMAARP